MPRAPVGRCRSGMECPVISPNHDGPCPVSDGRVISVHLAEPPAAEFDEILPDTVIDIRAALAPGAVGVLRNSISVAPVNENVPRFRADRKVRSCGTAATWTLAPFCLAPAHGAFHLHVAIAEFDIVRIVVQGTERSVMETPSINCFVNISVVSEYPDAVFVI